MSTKIPQKIEHHGQWYGDTLFLSEKFNLTRPYIRFLLKGFTATREVSAMRMGRKLFIHIEQFGDAMFKPVVVGNKFNDVSDL